MDVKKSLKMPRRKKSYKSSAKKAQIMRKVFYATRVDSAETYWTMKLINHIRVMDGEWTVEEVIRQTTDDKGESGDDEPFYMMDLGEVVKRYQCWKDLMPRVEPFYAVKSNPDAMLLRTLAALGAGFDCASRQEIDLVTGLGVEPGRIIYAHTTKMPSHMRFATRAGVSTTTFDSIDELIKIKNIMPHVKLVLRIRCDAKVSNVALGTKFGCDPVTEAPLLLKMASEQGLKVIGMSFHVGSGTKEFEAYARGIQHCAKLFEVGKALGFEMRLLDIGGGFLGDAQSTIHEVSDVVNKTLKKYFPDDSVRVIAEPGQYFSCAAYTLAACVFAKRQVLKDGQNHTMYYMSDGVFGSFMDCVLCDMRPTPLVVSPTYGKPEYCSLWGPTCDGNDCLLPSTLLPPLFLGSWLSFRNMGAYTKSLASTFHGFPKAKVHYVVDQSIWTVLQDTKFFTVADLQCNR